MSEFDELEQQIKTCTVCNLSKSRTNAVPGDGVRTAEIMFIGEGPGYYEDQQGLPFVGNAGNVLNQLLASIGLDRKDVYITNMVKCRPPENRDPLPDEIKACQGYMDKQIELIDPKVIVTLGRHSFGKFFPGEPISKARGKPRWWKGRMVFPVYHPAAVLHNPSLRSALEGDFKRMPGLIEQVMSQPAEQDEPEEQPQSQQLSLF